MLFGFGDIHQIFYFIHIHILHLKSKKDILFMSIIKIILVIIKIRNHSHRRASPKNIIKMKPMSWNNIFYFINEHYLFTCNLINRFETLYNKIALFSCS
jgi:hypothetical protein